MPAPFPGMDPFIESQRWRGFHTRTITAIAECLEPLLRPRYVVCIEDTVYLAAEDGDCVPHIEPIEEHYLVLRPRGQDEAVTVIELLSPTNKSSAEGRTEYLSKRAALTRGRVNIVEIDLLRAGRRLPTVEPLPTGDYFSFVSRVSQRPKVEVYSWPLESPLPTIQIPLSEGDPDVPLDLQSVFDLTYDRAGFSYALDYRTTVEPPLSDLQRAWVMERLASLMT